MRKDNVRRTVLLSFLGAISLMPLLVLPVMVGSFVDHLSLSDSQAGYVASAGFLGGALAAIFISLRIHHVDLRLMAYSGLGLMVLADGGSIVAQYMPFWMFVSLRFLSGIGGAAAYASVMGSFAGWREPDRAYGLFMAIQFALARQGCVACPGFSRIPVLPAFWSCLPCLISWRCFSSPGFLLALSAPGLA